VKKLVHLLGKSIAAVSLLTVLAIMTPNVVAYSDYQVDNNVQNNMGNDRLEPLFKNDSAQNIVEPSRPFEPEKADEPQKDEGFEFGETESFTRNETQQAEGMNPPIAKEKPVQNDWILTAVVVAAAGAIGLLANNSFKKSKENKGYESAASLSDLRSDISEDGDSLFEDYEELKNNVDEIIPSGEGIWIAPGAREEMVKEINNISAIQYKLDELGFLTIDNSLPIDETKSFKASKLIDRVIHEGNRTIVGVDEVYYRPNIRSGAINAVELDGGIKVGNDETDSVVILHPDRISGINLLHELGHVLEDVDPDVLAEKLENDIRRELGWEEREQPLENRELLYNNLNAGEGYLEDFAKEINATIIKDPFSDVLYVQLQEKDKLVVGYFNPDLNGTFLEPGTEKVVVRQKEFRYRMNMDLKEGEVYLRTFVESRGGNIEWFPEEEKAFINYLGRNYEIYPMRGEHNSYIVNDRIAISEEMARELMELQTNNSFVNDSANTTGTFNYDGYSDSTYTQAFNQLEVEMVENDVTNIEMKPTDRDYLDKMASEVKNTISQDVDLENVDFEELADEVIKEFRFRLNLDIHENEVYLRSYIEDLNGEVLWDEIENKAIINLNGKSITLEPGEFGSRIVNDRLVLDQEMIEGLLEINHQSPNVDLTNAKPVQTSATTPENMEGYNFGSGYEKYMGASLVSGGLIFRKYKRDILTSVSDGEEEESIAGFIQGIKEGIRDLGFEAKDLLDNNFVQNELNEAGRFLARAAWVENGNERNVILKIVERELFHMKEVEIEENVFGKAKNFAKTFVPCMLASSVLGGLGASLHTVETILDKDLDHNKKLQIMKKHTEFLLNIQEYLRACPRNLNEMVFSAMEKRDEYVLNLWEWDIQVMIKKGLLNPKQDAILYKFSLLD
jgi:translation elongation factor EF-1beta